MAWLTGWSYRKAIVIAPSADGAQSDYQLKLLVGESAGASGEQVDCAGHVLSSFDDLRFTTSDGVTLCPYWIESVTGTTPNRLATIWIKIPSIAASPAAATIYMYYGNAGASSESSGTDTFIAFDDFERGSDGDPVGGSWGTVTNVEIDTAIYWPGAGSTRSGRWVGGTAQARINRAASSSIAIQMRMIKTDAGAPIVWHGDAGSRMYALFTGTENWMFYDGSYHTVEALSHSTWYLFEYRNFDYDANTYDMVRDGVVKRIAAAQEASAAANGIIWIYNSAASGDINIDNLIVRKWTPSEPAWSSFGTEEYLPTPPPDYHVILSGVYSEEAPEINRAFVVGMDAAGGQVSGAAVAQAEVDLVGERTDAHHDPAIPTAAVAAAVAAAMLAKCRLDGRRAEIVIPPHCGLELWDVLAVIDTVANQDTLYRVSGYQLEYDTVKGAYFHRLQLCAL
ncbi:MAG: DUF2341 domain-containing protein [Dehalococcoidia bacterium]|jgi:hypothetical protein